MTVVGYHDPPDWDYNQINEHGGQNWSTQILGVIYIVIGPLLLMNMVLAITVNNTKNLRERGKFFQTKTRVKDFLRYALFSDACFDFVFKKIAPGFFIMDEFRIKEHNGRMVNILTNYELLPES